MRMALEGRISLALRPYEYNKEYWTQHKDIDIVKDLLAMHKVETIPEQIKETLEQNDQSEDSDDEISDEDNELSAVNFAGKNKFNALTTE